MPTLHYLVDPMCSWCYGFSQEMRQITNELPDSIELRYVMGGLAPDSDEPMPEEMRRYVQQAWHTVAEKTGANFNYDFWTECQPKRSTYPSCRAVIAAGLQGQDNIPLMLAAVQKAYYQQARNPSANETLIEIAAEIGLDRDRFAEEIGSTEVEERLQAGFRFKDTLGVRGFPTLALEKDDRYYGLTVGYTKAEVVLRGLTMVLNDETQIDA